MTKVWSGQTIGILGGGQLGRMMAVAAKHMGYRIAVLDPSEDCPCAQVADHHIVASYDDQQAAHQLSDLSDVITYEFENVDLDVARIFEQQDKLPQGAYALEVTQNRQKEKEVATAADLPVASYEIVTSFDACQQALERIGLPAVIKTVSGGYDGKGQVKLADYEDIESARNFIVPGDPYIVEQWLDFDCEISQVFTRSPRGEICFFPVAENIHRDHMLFQSLVPARVPEHVTEKAQTAARRIAETMGIVGTFAVELFVRGDDIYVNEMAPRPHNSGHYTIEACNVSQFEQHVRSICNLPLLPVHSLPAAIMVNVLGQHQPLLETQVEKLPWAHLHDYGKKEARPKRKMGHITVTGSSLQELTTLIEKSPVAAWERIGQEEEV
ncbi:5-(carboxyamino)imidazole ribonucleotide synthase [Thalassobacillus sp. CUG 92003]|uniref:5-(carboxyamino)imidazole ribonucleotide synthase n=1 Tax=Thalassobacillus sp. CUG 92003 TaxID=2736641 RepID=UPI0015E6E13B|nr:5-(carboxyamino)imidazole ribonucleotide synthase [Thalassobacillus sp. CUG 92003]